MSACAAVLRFVVVLRRFPLDHEVGARADRDDGAELDREGCLSAEQDDCEERGQDRARLVYGHDLVDVTERKRLEVADPRCTGRESRGDEKRPREGSDAGYPALCAGDEDDDPGKDEHDRGSNARGDVGIGLPHAAFRENRGYTREERREQCRANPTHGSRPRSSSGYRRLAGPTARDSTGRCRHTCHRACESRPVWCRAARSRASRRDAVRAHWSRRRR